MPKTNICVIYSRVNSSCSEFCSSLVIKANSKPSRLSKLIVAIAFIYNELISAIVKSLFSSILFQSGVRS